MLDSFSAEFEKLPYFKDDLFAVCEEEFFDAQTTMLTMLDEVEQSSNQNTSSAEISLNASSGSRSRPRIDIPKFSGTYSEWSNFRDLFTSIIIENADLSAIEQLHYLKMSLSGEPSQHLKNIAMFGDNFTRTWDQLVARYKNKRILINAYLNSLMDTRKVKNENSVDIKRLLGDVKEALGALETLGCPVQHWDLIVIFLMV